MVPKKIRREFLEETYVPSYRHPPVESQPSKWPVVTPFFILTPETAARAYRGPPRSPLRPYDSSSAATATAARARRQPRKESIGKGLNPSSAATATTARACRPLRFPLKPRKESIGKDLNPLSAATATGTNVEVIHHSLLNMDLGKSSEEKLLLSDTFATCLVIFIKPSKEK